MELKINQWYEKKDYNESLDKRYKYIRVDDVVEDKLSLDPRAIGYVVTIFTENFIKERTEVWDIRYIEDKFQEVPKTLQTLCVGDILTDGEDYVEVLGVINQNCYVVSDYTSNLDGEELTKVGATFSIKDLENVGYRPYTTEEIDIKEMTVKEISEELGYEVKIIKE